MIETLLLGTLLAATPAAVLDAPLSAPEASEPADEAPTARDPFVPLAPAFDALGGPSASWGEIRLRGFLVTPNGGVALLEGAALPAVRVGDRLRDAEIVRIDAENGVLVLREPAPTVAGFRDVVLTL